MKKNVLLFVFAAITKVTFCNTVDLTQYVLGSVTTSTSESNSGYSDPKYVYDSTQFLELNDGDYAIILSIYGNNLGWGSSAVVIKNEKIYYAGVGSVITGPAKIYTGVDNPNGYQMEAVMEYALKTPTNPSSVTTTPTGAVVIPTNANGAVEIILESSVDLVNWNAATPGQYSAATENRFFRVRAVITSN